MNNAPAFFINQVARMKFYDFNLIHQDYRVIIGTKIAVF